MQCFEFLLHALQLVIVAVLRIFAADVGDGRRGEEASKRIDMPVGIVALDLSVGERKETLAPKDLNEVLTERFVIDARIAVGLDYYALSRE